MFDGAGLGEGNTLVSPREDSRSLSVDVESSGTTTDAQAGGGV